MKKKVLEYTKAIIRFFSVNNSDRTYAKMEKKYPQIYFSYAISFDLQGTILGHGDI